MDVPPLIAALSAWLGRLMIILVAAGILDLLLPENRLRRYVDVVLGLIVLVLLLQPLFDWMNRDLEALVAEQVAALAERWPQAAMAVPSPQAAIAEGVQWRLAQSEQVLRGQVERLAREALAEAAPGIGAAVRLAGVEFVWRKPAEAAPYEAIPQLERMIVWIVAPDDHALSADDITINERVQAVLAQRLQVAPAQIDVRRGARREGAGR